MAEKYVAERLISRVDTQLVADIAAETGVSAVETNVILSAKYPNGLVDSFLSEYVQMAFESHDRATEFEGNNLNFADIFGLYAEHDRSEGHCPGRGCRLSRRGWSGILDSKAYAKGIRYRTQTTVTVWSRYIERYPVWS